MRLNFQKTPAPNKSDGIESFSLGVLLPTKRDRELAAHIFKPDLTVNEDFKQREVAVDFKWQPAGQASISGTVMTLANKPVASAQVLLEMPQSGFWQMTYSKQDGSFFLNNLPAGNFTLSVLQAETDGWINSTCAGKLEKQSKQELPNLYAVPCKSQVSWADKPTAANVEFCFFGEAIHLFKTDESGRINLPELPKNYDLVALAPDIEITEFKNSVLYGSANKTLNKETIALLPREETWNHKFLFKANPAAKEITLPGSLDCQLALLSARQGQKIQSSISFQTLPGQALQLAELPAVTRVASSSNSITFTGAPDIDQLLLLSETRERFVAKINEPINLPVGKYRIMAGKGNKRGSFNRLKAQLKNRVVFIGTALPEDQDFVTTPINFMDVSFKRLPGVHIHANLFSGLARNDFLAPSFLHADRAPHSWPLLQILAILPVLLLCNLIFAKFGAFWGGLSIIFSLLAWGLVTTTAFINATIFPAFFPALNITAFGIVRGYLAWEISKRKEQETRSTFGRFISSAVVNEILKKPGSLKPGGEKKELSVMFTDLAGFTTISEKLSPEQLTELMNEYLGEMTNLLFKYQGTLDKYIGDAIMAFWNHPVDQPNHPDLAAECAIAMQKKLDELRQKWLKQGLPEVKVRAGINTASCMVGFIGSDVQMNFTCLGDGVNLASRLEGANKPYDTLMMISESVNLRLDQNKFSTRFLDYLAVKGKDQPIKVYELRGLLAEESEEWLAAKDHYQQGMQHYLERNWGAAIKCFKQVLKKLKNDSPSRIFIERSEHFKQEPPPENWDGRFVLKTK
jgi:class 3 adenylate cyclase